MNHPDINSIERFGSLWDFSEPQYIGECSLSSCHSKDIYDNFEYWTDDCGHLFCCREHADLFYGLRAVDN